MIAQHLSSNVLWTFAGIVALLVTASVLVAFFSARRGAAAASELALRVRSWWVMATMFALAMLLHPKLSVAFFAFTSFLALKEYLSLIPPDGRFPARRRDAALGAHDRCVQSQSRGVPAGAPG